MSPLMMRFFALVGIALAAASMQLQARAETPQGPGAQQVRAGIPAQLKALSEGAAQGLFETAMAASAQPGRSRR